MKILVTGATGRVGGAVVDGLLKRGASVRALVRKTTKSSNIPQGVEAAWGDLADPPSIFRALEGIDRLFLLIANVADEFTQTVSAYGLAKRAGVKHTSLTSPSSRRIGSWMFLTSLRRRPLNKL